MQLVGRYELKDRIGEGAMAEVWRAYDPGIDRTLAIKLLKPEFRSQAEYATRFLREARAAGALAHPSIVTIYDVGEADGFPYIAMELLDGQPLDRALAVAGRFTDEAVLSIGAQLASALSYAHLSGVVHRDIKPSNIMILDFGIARVAEARASDEALKTQLGQVLGTPRYMSPEQALGRSVDGRSDIFSAGAVLYELITGRHAFDATSAATLALQITQQNPPSITESTPQCPGGLRFIVEKLLAKRPERRFSDGAELGRAIERERKAFEALKADEAGRGRYLPLQVRLTAAMVAVTAVALLLSVSAVLYRPYRAMERMAIASGSSIAAFVASNAALPAVENAAANADERDWSPIQAFIAAAAKDQAVRWMTMVDADGVIRGASDPSSLGSRYRAPKGEAVVFRSPEVTVTDIRLDGGEGFRFVHPILYAGRSFGLIEVSISKAELEAAAETSRNLLWALCGVVLCVVGGVSFAMAKFLARPVRRLKQAIRDTAMGDFDFRISHNRHDEFGELFDSFNLMVAAVQERLDAEARPSGQPRPLEATIVAPAKAASAEPAGTPFDPAWRQRA